MNPLRCFTYALILLSLLCSIAQGLEVPVALQPWEEWVLHGSEHQRCPAHYNNGEMRRCWWPSQLELDVGDGGGHFTFHVTVYASTWVTLPGDRTYWPESVFCKRKPVPVTRRNDLPAVRLDTGEWQLTGSFSWETLPEILTVPSTTGLIALKVNGRERVSPELTPSGRLRIHQNIAAPDKEDTTAVTLFRLVEDELPMRMTTRIMLQISGKPRQLLLEALFPENSTVMDLTSPLPARLADQGSLILQAKPGKWEIQAVVRIPGPVQRLSIGEGRYGEEIWSFKAANQLRMVRVSGAPSIEPSRTRMPDAWKQYPAYSMKPGDSLSFETIRRGDPEPAPNRLSLVRTWWLDFDGAGFTVRDQLQGSLSRTWHLSMMTPMELGRVAVDGKDQLITLQGDPPLPGVQLRRGLLHLEAESRLPRKSSAVPAVGWAHDFEGVRGVLHLPPGWTLFATSNVDSPPATWLQQWSLLDIFLVLIIAISAFKLFNAKTGFLALATLVLILHEPGAPTTIWLLLLALTALNRYLPDNRLKQLTRWVNVASMMALIAISLPFMIQQVRTAIYPQLEEIGRSRFPRPSVQNTMLDAQTKMAARSESAAEFLAGKERRMSKAIPKAPLVQSFGREKRFDTDPDALIQTGPGLPTWQWKSMQLKWNGPVDRTQQIRFWLISPALNGLLGLTRFVLVVALAFIFIRRLGWRRYVSKPFATGSSAVILFAVLMLCPQCLRADGAHAGFPPRPLLEELKQRLLEPLRCLPHCADVDRLELTATEDQLSLVLTVHAIAETAVPLPATMETWRPRRVAMKETPGKSIARDRKGTLWMVVPKGIHTVEMTGAIGAINEVRISFPILPHQSHFYAEGWQARGFKAGGQMDSTIVLTRIQEGTSPLRETAKVNIPAFFHVTRTLHLGIQWEATTHIRRLTPTGDPVRLSIPLLENASLTTAGIEVKEAAAQIPMGPEQTEASFSSALPFSEKISLKAPVNVPWVETWILDASTIWQCEISGLPVMHHQDVQQSWQPSWRPWPGENVTLRITRPEPVTGRTLTIDRVRLDFTPGQRITQADMALEVRSSKGGDHQIELPDQINLQAVKVKGKKLPVRLDGKRVTIPVTPGSQGIEIQWNQPTDSRVWIQGPTISVGDSAVNAAVSFHMPDQRWILFAGGPRLGPAVLFWSYGFIIVVIAYGLGKTTYTPLRVHQWVLLALGLTQVSAFVAMTVAGWFFALAYREKMEIPQRPILFNLTQLMIFVVTMAALAGLYIAIEGGLLGIPNMQIAGNQSTQMQLNWTQDRIEGILPTPWVISLPLWAYRILMLAWSLWLAFSLVAWLKWGWHCFSKERLWKPIRWPRRAQSNEKNVGSNP